MKDESPSPPISGLIGEPEISKELYRRRSRYIFETVPNDKERIQKSQDDGWEIQKRNKRVYPGFPTIFRGLSEFFVGDLMGKALWKLVENAQRFPRRGGRVLCVHGPVSFHRARPCATKWPPRRGLRTGPPASSDCGRP